MSHSTNHLFFHIFIPVLSCKSPAAAQQPSTNHSASCRARPFQYMLIFLRQWQISLLRSHFVELNCCCSPERKFISFLRRLVLFEAWIIFIFLPRVLLFVVLMFAPCKHVNFNFDNKAWRFCLCCRSSFDGGCLGKGRDHLWSRVFRGNTLLSKERWRSDHTHKDDMKLLMRP